MSGKFRHSESNIRGITIRLGQDAEQRCAAISREPAEGLLQVNKRGPIPFRSSFYTFRHSAFSIDVRSVAKRPPPKQLDGEHDC